MPNTGRAFPLSAPPPQAMLRLDDVLSATLQAVRDQAGTDSLLQLATTSAAIVGSDDDKVPLTITGSTSPNVATLLVQDVLGTSYVSFTPESGTLLTVTSAGYGDVFDVGYRGKVTMCDGLVIDNINADYARLSGKKLVLMNEHLGLLSGSAIGFDSHATVYSSPEVVLSQHDTGTAKLLDVSGGGIRVPAGTATDPAVLVNTVGLYETGGTLTVGTAGSYGDFYASAITAASYLSTPLVGRAGATLTLQNAALSAADNAVEMATGVFTNSSGTAGAVAILPTYNQSGTAAATDLLINRTETAVGSGNQYLIEGQVGGSQILNFAPPAGTGYLQWPALRLKNLYSGGYTVVQIGSLGTNLTGIRLHPGQSGDAAIDILSYSSSGTGIGFRSTDRISWNSNSAASIAGDLIIDRHTTALATYLDVSTGGGIRVPLGTAVDPSLTIGNDGTGLYATSATNMGISHSGTNTWILNSANIRAAASGGARIETTSSATAPALTFTGDTNTGIGRAGADQLSLIAGGIEGIRITEATSLTGTLNGSLVAATGDETAWTLNYTTNKATSGDSYGLVIDHTDTASPDETYLADFRVGGSSKLAVYGAGHVVATGKFASGETNGFRVGSAKAYFTDDGLYLSGNDVIEWATNATSYTGGADISLAKYASGTANYVDVATGGGIRVPAGTATDPSVMVGANSIGLYESAASTLGFSFGGSLTYAISSSSISCNGTAGKPIILNEVASSTNPVYAFHSDNNSGLGRAAADQPSIIANATEVARFMLDGSSNPVAKIMSVLGIVERSSDPAAPAEGECIVWQSDGTGKGDDGDVMIATNAGGTTKYGTLFDHSGGSAW